MNMKKFRITVICSDGEVEISKNGVNEFSMEEVKEIVNDVYKVVEGEQHSVEVRITEVNHYTIVKHLKEINARYKESGSLIFFDGREVLYSDKEERDTEDEMSMSLSFVNNGFNLIFGVKFEGYDETELLNAINQTNRETCSKCHLNQVKEVIFETFPTNGVTFEDLVDAVNQIYYDYNLLMKNFDGCYDKAILPRWDYNN
jgi:hypothetical protein